MNGLGFYPPPYGAVPFMGFPNNYEQGPLPIQQALPPSYYGPPQPQQLTDYQTINGHNNGNMSSYKLYDFEMNTRNEIIRLIFSFVGVPFKDKRVKQEEWNRVKDRIPVQQLPILRVNNRCKIYYLDAIVRFLAREFYLYGTDNNDHVIVDIILEANREIQEKLFKETSAYTTFEERQAGLTQFITDHARDYLNQFEKLYKIFDRQGPFYLGSQISVADLIVYQTINYMIDIDTKLLDNYPHLQEARHYLEKHPQLANYSNKNNSKEKRKRHTTVPPTPRNHRHHHHRHRSHDGHRHHRHSKEPTSPVEPKEESISPVQVHEQPITPVQAKEKSISPTQTKGVSKSPSIQSEEKKPLSTHETEVIQPAPIVGEEKSEDTNH